MYCNNNLLICTDYPKCLNATSNCGMYITILAAEYFLYEINQSENKNVFNLHPCLFLRKFRMLSTSFRLCKACESSRQTFFLAICDGYLFTTCPTRKGKHVSTFQRFTVGQQLTAIVHKIIQTVRLFTFFRKLKYTLISL